MVYELMIFLAYFSKYLSKLLAHIGLNSRYYRFNFISLFYGFHCIIGKEENWE